MKKIATLHERDIYPNKESVRDVIYSDRLTGKAIVFDENNKIALVGNKQNHFLLLPGGGIYEGEDIKIGIVRECLEEIGYPVILLDEIGCIDDYRSRDKKHCINYCYTAKTIGPKVDTKHTDNEAIISMFTKWHTFEEAEKILEEQQKELREGKVNFYNTGFNIVRDLLFLKEAKSREKILYE